VRRLSNVTFALAGVCAVWSAYELGGTAAAAVVVIVAAIVLFIGGTVGLDRYRDVDGEQ
jgi:4-hydroxybenzoate polyprenyltransferase